MDFSERVNVEIGLETDLAPREFRQLLDTFSHPLLKANYDIGNSASLGYNIEEEFNEYGSYINNIHIKDRKRNGGTVPLGTGDADFKKFFEMVQKIGYTGSFILQAARERSEIETAKKNIAFVKNMLKGRTQ